MEAVITYLKDMVGRPEAMYGLILIVLVFVNMLATRSIGKRLRRHIEGHSHTQPQSSPSSPKSAPVSNLDNQGTRPVRH